jgi:hypothetical protein
MTILTIILLIYVALDIILDTIAIILLKRKGITLRGMANQLRWVLTNRNSHYDNDDYDDEYDDYNFLDEEDIDDQGYGNLQEEYDEIRS